MLPSCLTLHVFIDRVDQFVIDHMVEYYQHVCQCAFQTLVASRASVLQEYMFILVH
jgi:hypothetical protein